MSDHRDDARERPISPVHVPSSIAPWVDGCRWSRNLVGEAGAAVYRIARPDADTRGNADAASRDLYLKHGRGSVATEVFDEAVKLRWLGAHVAVPAVRLVIASTASDRSDRDETSAIVQHRVDASSLEDETWLLMDALPGRTAYQLLEASANSPDVQHAVVDALVAFLQRVHAIPVKRCPFINDHHRKLVHARARLEAGAVDVDDFGDMHHGWTAQQVWDSVIALLPRHVDAVVTHGDFSLDNVLLSDRAANGTFDVTGCLDAGRVGIADRYQDLAVLYDCLAEFGETLQARVFTQYGINEVDELKLRFHLALDEFF